MREHRTLSLSEVGHTRGRPYHHTWCGVIQTCLGDGKMFACGKNVCGQLGLGDYDERHTFTAVPALPEGKVAKQVVAGHSHTVILAEDGTVFACGWNDEGQLGLGDTTNRNTFTAVPALPDGKVAKQMIAGESHTVILAEDGTVFACGWNH